jgi:hypothetical protein
MNKVCYPIQRKTKSKKKNKKRVDVVQLEPTQEPHQLQVSNQIITETKELNTQSIKQVDVIPLPTGEEIFMEEEIILDEEIPAFEIPTSRRLCIIS